MIVAMGSIIDELMKYSNHVESKMVGSTPVIKAYLAQTNCITKVYIYIAQVSDDTYTAYADEYDSNGYMLIPTGDPRIPFMREIERVNHLPPGGIEINEYFSSNVMNVSYAELIDFIYETLMDYHIFALNPNTMNSKITSFGFTSPKLIRAIEKSFIVNNKRDGTVHDMYNIIVRDKSKFILNEIKSKDRKILIKKLSEHGIHVTINNDKIIDITFKRR